jgi:hypothetical protein
VDLIGSSAESVDLIDSTKRKDTGSHCNDDFEILISTFPSLSACLNMSVLDMNCFKTETQQNKYKSVSYAFNVASVVISQILAVLFWGNCNTIYDIMFIIS